MRKEFHLKYLYNFFFERLLQNRKCELIYFIHKFTVSIFYSRSHNVKCNLCNFRQALCIIMNTKRRIKGLNVIVEKNILANLSVPPQFTADNYTFYNNLTYRCWAGAASADLYPPKGCTRKNGTMFCM